jgi:hypothetical protein
MVGEDHRDPGLARRARDRHVGLAVGELEHADRREQERARKPPAKQLDAGVALLDVAEHARDDPPLVERGAVRRHRALVSGAGGDVGERLGTHPLLGGLLEAPGFERDPGPAPADALEVDVSLAPHADHAAASQHT